MSNNFYNPSNPWLGNPGGGYMTNTSGSAQQYAQFVGATCNSCC